MNLRQIRWPVVLLALALTLAGLFGTGQLVKSQTIDQPLLQALAKLPDLESYTVRQAGDRPEITIRIKGSADLKKAYGAVDQQVRQILGPATYVISLEDRRTPELEQAAARLDLYVQEGIATGGFAAMADRLEAEARQVGASAQVAVDGERVYVTIRKGEGYLYSVVERPAVRTPMQKEGGLGL